MSTVWISDATGRLAPLHSCCETGGLARIIQRNGMSTAYKSRRVCVQDVSIWRPGGMSRSVSGAVWVPVCSQQQVIRNKMHEAAKDATVTRDAGGGGLCDECGQRGSNNSASQTSGCEWTCPHSNMFGAPQRARLLVGLYSNLNRGRHHAHPT